MAGEARLRSTVVVGYPPEKICNECRADPKRVQSCDMKDRVQGGYRRRRHDTEARTELSLQDPSEEGLVSGRVEKEDGDLKIDRISGGGNQRIDRGLRCRSDAEGVVRRDQPCSSIEDAVEGCRAGQSEHDWPQAWPPRHERPLSDRGPDHTRGGDEGRFNEVRRGSGEEEEHRRDYNREADSQSCASRQYDRGWANRVKAYSAPPLLGLLPAARGPERWTPRPPSSRQGPGLSR